MTNEITRATQVYLSEMEEIASIRRECARREIECWKELEHCLYTQVGKYPRLTQEIRDHFEHERINI